MNTPKTAAELQTASTIAPPRVQHRVSPRVRGMLWEVYARLGYSPEKAADLMCEQGVVATASEARAELHGALHRNTLRLVFRCWGRF